MVGEERTTRSEGRRRGASVAFALPAGVRALEGGHVVEMQRRRLLLGLSEVLAENGLEGAGISRICKRASVSRRTFYDLFDDREECFAALLDTAIERIARTAAVAYLRGDSWHEQVRGGLAAILDFFESEPVLGRVCLIEAFKAGPEVIERRQRALDELSGVVDQGRPKAKDGGPPPLTAQSTVGGALSVIQAHVLQEGSGSLTGLLNPLMSMIVHPYLGAAAARRELECSTPRAVHASASDARLKPLVSDPFKDLPIRITLRTARVLKVIEAQPGASNRQIGDGAGVSDQGQISKLLKRLRDCDLIENHVDGHANGEANAWQLTDRGLAVQRVIDSD
jgi:AcrR family transcriptional regulator/DNA-binding MarR family transcriptional regulator